jgi:hypothetical protein
VYFLISSQFEKVSTELFDQENSEYLDLPFQASPKGGWIFDFQEVLWPGSFPIPGNPLIS